MTDNNDQKKKKRTTTKLVVATRLHLGNAKEPPSTTKTKTIIEGFVKFVSLLSSSSSSSSREVTAVIAVDPQHKFDGYDYVESIRQSIPSSLESSSESMTIPRVHVLPVTPWGKFTPALNAIISYSAKEEKADLILFVSAETQATYKSIDILCRHVLDDNDDNDDDDTTLVAGALLGGHDYQHHHPEDDGKSSTIVELNGRTTPWNTLAVWRVSKLALTGFQLVSEGILTDETTQPSYGVEEAFCIALLQKLLGVENAKAKLVKLPDVQWDQKFQDEDRRKWHETKMKSKIDRADRQFQLAFGLTGKVHHC